MKRYIYATGSNNKKYTYSGYVTDGFGNNLGEVNLITYAPSKAKASTNFKFQIRNKLGKVNNFKIYIDESKIQLVN